ncbi:PEP-CTERM sorting domain-containing protein [Microcystis aeruginosa]|uniref:PEP-CTERM sorting domain-containing protein n=1 Tax=Microcystis aeruginosa TaxID=1126 RepID=UPI00352C4662
MLSQLTLLNLQRSSVFLGYCVLCRFVVASNWGFSGATGFSEVQFDGTPVPEPSALLALLAFGLGGVSLRKRL